MQLREFLIVVVYSFISCNIAYGFSSEKAIKTGSDVAQVIINKPITEDYDNACANYGVLQFANVTANKSLRDKVAVNYTQFIAGKEIKGGHVDSNVFGILGFELFLQTNNNRFVKLSKYLADDEWLNPREDGLVKYTRFWVDDMFMVGTLQVQAFRATNNPMFLDKAAIQLFAYSKKLQQENGLFWHTLNAPVFWGRGNGWAAVGLTLTLQYMPADHPQYADLMKIYKHIMSVLPKYQDSNGLWHQVITDRQSFAETSCTGMFTFALATGVRNGWLDDTFKPTIYKAWDGLLAHAQNGQVSDVCIGTGESQQYNDYLNRPRSTGDMHGQAAFLWAASALLQMNQHRIEN